MSILLLRTLTRKSLIGFGEFKDLTVQNLIDTLRHKELLSLYYTCRNLDYNEELINELKINKVYRIDKKNKQEERYIKNSFSYINKCLDLIISEDESQMNIVKMRLGVANKKTQSMAINKKDEYNRRKIVLRSKNQFTLR